MKSYALLAASVLLLAGCAATPPAEDDGTIRIVATTNVYGDLAQTIGGDLVSVTSIITSAAQDPHSYEASAQDQLALAQADVIIRNGGGYDSFIDPLVAASDSNAILIDVAQLVELPEGENEHLWYDFESMNALTEELAAVLAERDPANTSSFEANFATFALQLDELESLVGGIADGEGVAITEPVPLYLLEAAGFENLSPQSFTEAIEEGADVPPAALLEMLDLFENDAVVMLAYNEQTASPETERVRDAASEASVPVVDFTETLPDGETYVSWMTANIDAIAAAL